MATTQIGRLKPFVFLQEVRTELSKVSWPSRSQAIRFTLLVVVVSMIVAAFIGGLDYVFTKLIELILRK